MRGEVDTADGGGVTMGALSGDPIPFMGTDEVAFLAAHLTTTDHVWEWGSGASTTWLAKRTRYVTSVDHQRSYAAATIITAPDNVALVFAPPDLPYVEGTDDDGTLGAFRHYVEAYTGSGIDVVIIDGRARVACAQYVAQRAPFGPHPGMKIFLHDCQREQLAPIWVDKPGVPSFFAPVERVGNLVMMEARF